MIKNCADCGQLHSGSTSDFCSECRGTHFNTVAAYLKGNSSSNAVDIARDTGVPLKFVFELVNDGSLKH